MRDAIREYIADVQASRFTERGHLVKMEALILDEVVRSIGGAHSLIVQKGEE